MFTFNASAIAAAPSGLILLPVIFLSWIEMVVGCVCPCVISHCFFILLMMQSLVTVVFVFNSSPITIASMSSMTLPICIWRMLI